MRDLWRPGGGASRLTHRRVRVLVDGLPPESMTKTAIRDRMTSADFEAAPEPDGWGQWSSTDTMLAVIADRLSWVIHAIYAAQGCKPAEPEPIRRPGVGLSGAERKRHEERTQALVAYTREHGGAYPPPEWFADFD